MKHFLLAMATLWCVASTFSSFAADNNKWKPLFGKNLENANYNPEVWSETDGVLGAVKDESIWTKDEYENFELDLDFKTDVGTNSGVVVYCTDTKDWIPNSVEIQIADDHCEKWGNGKPYEKCGAIYGHLGAVQDKVVKKPGEWNHMRIKCAGQHIMVILNGKKVTEMDMSKWTSGTKNPDGSDIPSWLPKPFAELPTKGFIGLQGKHGDSLIWFRNIKIKELPRKTREARLFNGEDITNWDKYGTELWYVKDGLLVCESGPDKQYGYLATREYYDDFDLTVEFKQEADGNSGVFIRSFVEEKDVKVNGWQVEVAPKGFDTAVAEAVSELTGKPFVTAPNKFHALTSKDELVFAHGALKGLAADMMKIANDVRWLASGPRCGLGEIHPGLRQLIMSRMVQLRNGCMR